MPCLALLMNEYADKQIKKTQKTMPVSISFNVSLCLLKNYCCSLLPGILLVVVLFMVHFVTETEFATFVRIAKINILPKSNATLLVSHVCIIGLWHLGLACLSSRAVYVLASPLTRVSNTLVPAPRSLF